MPLLSIIDLKVYFHTPEGVVRAVDRVCLEIREGETLALVGETGCGKTVLALSILRLLPQRASLEGKILYQGTDLLSLNEEEMRRIRGREIALILQNPSSSLNPLIPVGEQVSESIKLHQLLNGKGAREKALEILGSMGIAATRTKAYPHQLSAGMRQRVMLATALACNPTLVIADESTKGLDPPVKIQILRLMKRLQENSKRSLFFITHDLKAAAAICDRVAVMYGGEIVEYGTQKEIFTRPGHPYTRGLLNSLPEKGLKSIPGFSPSLIDLPEGCRFHRRCPLSEERCKGEHPRMIKLEQNYFIRCFLHDRS